MIVFVAVSFPLPATHRFPSALTLAVFDNAFSHNDMTTHWTHPLLLDPGIV